MDPDCTGISEAADSDGSMTSILIASGLVKPLFVTAAPGDVDRIFITEQDGRIRIVKNGSLLATPFLDIDAITQSSGDEEGLLGLAFHPSYDDDGVDDWLFVYHTDNSGNQVVARYSRDGSNADLADPTSRVVVRTINHPVFGNHNGGMIAFGPHDGKLYIGTGDGGGGCDPFNTGQNLNDDRAKLLRLDVDSLPATNPSDNPFFGGANTADDDVWAWGLRNPWRFSFDLDPDYDGDGTQANRGDLYIGDVGQNAWEEIDYQVAASTGGENYGWVEYEGTHCPNPSCGDNNCGIANVLPILEYEHLIADCNSVTGGYVYRGCRMPDVRGTYFYGEYCRDWIRTFRVVGGVATAQTDRTSELQPSGPLVIREITSFGQDARGELYVVDRGTIQDTGEVWKFVPILKNLEVSGIGATPFLIPPSGNWTWEDLQASSMHPLTEYIIYRSEDPAATFCVIGQSPTPSWTGDTEVPGDGAVFFYLVTAVNAAGEETSPGKASDGTARSVDSGTNCP
jgi:glucose/arabinose dehydrogenase